MTITLPIRTVSEANRRDHWAKKAKRIAEQRVMVDMCCSTPFCRLRMLLPCLARLTRVAPRELDDDNLRGALKAVRDGVADALGVKDNDPRVTWEYAQRRGKPREYAVTITINLRGE